MGNNGKDKLPLIERYGLWYMQRLRKKHPLDRVDTKTHILDAEERKQINQVVRKAIINVSVAGAVSSIISGIAAFYADPLLDASSDFFSRENMLYWTVVMGVTILASLIEIVYIYHDVMAKTHALTRAAHLKLFDDDNQQTDIANSLVRAALELPNKKDADIDIDPRRESSKLMLVLATIIYKLKISASNFLLKALVKRMLGRAISRAWLNFLSVPVCAFWNGIVCWLVIREAKIRVLGPSAANEILNQLDDPTLELSEYQRYALLMAVGSCIVSTADLHPNLEYLYRSLDAKVAEPSNTVFDNTKLFLAELGKLESTQQKIVLRMLVYAAILDGKITFKERKLLSSAYKICNTPFSFKEIKTFLNTFRAGEMVDFNLV